LPAFFAAYSAWSAARKREVGLDPSNGCVEMPAEIRSGKPASVGPSASTLRIWPPSASAASIPALGSITTNSSPPSRAVSAPSGTVSEKVCDLPKQRVTELVTGAVVDLLEVVTVDDEEAGRTASVAPSGNARSDSMFNRPTTARPSRSGTASSETTPGNAGT
jgi:hypothetical protein